MPSAEGAGRRASQRDRVGLRASGAPGSVMASTWAPEARTIARALALIRGTDRGQTADVGQGAQCRPRAFLVVQPVRTGLQASRCSACAACTNWLVTNWLGSVATSCAPTFRAAATGRAQDGKLVPYGPSWVRQGRYLRSSSDWGRAARKGSVRQQGDASERAARGDAGRAESKLPTSSEGGAALKQGCQRQPPDAGGADAGYPYGTGPTY